MLLYPTYLSANNKAYGVETWLHKNRDFYISHFILNDSELFFLNFSYMTILDTMTSKCYCIQQIKIIYNKRVFEIEYSQATVSAKKKKEIDFCTTT